jgi:hypothetical protein
MVLKKQNDVLSTTYRGDPKVGRESQRAHGVDAHGCIRMAVVSISMLSNRVEFYR